MALSDKDKLNRLEDLKTKLYSRDYQTKVEHQNSYVNINHRTIPESWQKNEGAESDFEEKFFMKTSMFKKFFIFSIVIFILALIYAGYTFFANSNTVSNDNIDINILSNAYTEGGEEYSLLAQITNKNNSPLEFADLVVEYPKSSDLNAEREYLRISLGTIPAGAIRNENTKIILFGEQASLRQIKISLEYRVEGSNAIFVKEKTFDISINSTPVSLTVAGPTEVTTNGEISFDIKTVLNATRSANKMLLKVDYPVGFQFVSAKPAPAFSNNIWNLGDLAPGSESTVSIVGKMIDVYEGEEKVFRVWNGSQSGSDKANIDVVFNSSEYKVAVKSSSVDAKLMINGESASEYTIDTKTSIQAQINWRNNMETKLSDLRIEAKISGNAFNQKSVTVRDNGYYNSATNTIVWDKNNQTDFKEVNSGENGSVSFSLSPNALFSASGGMLSTPTINIVVNISGRRAENGDIVTQLINPISRSVKIVSDLSMSTKALYYSGVFKNTGPIPPKVGQKTTYTIIWSIANTANNVSRAQVRSSLPSWINFVGSTSPASEDLSYNSTTREIIWNIGSILKGAGITGSNKSVSFQVELTPSLSQLGQSPILINETTLTAYDDFAKVDIRVNKGALNTRLLSDTSFPVGGDKVIE